MNTDKISRQYIKQGLFLAVGMFMIGLIVMQVWQINTLFTPLVISVVFSLFASITIGMVWNRVAKKSPDSLPTFHTAVSGFRMLLALVVMFVYYLVDMTDSMTTFFLVFLAFYFVMLGQHVMFFSRVSKQVSET